MQTMKVGMIVLNEQNRLLCRHARQANGRLPRRLPSNDPLRRKAHVYDTAVSVMAFPTCGWADNQSQSFCHLTTLRRKAHVYDKYCCCLSWPFLSVGGQTNQSRSVSPMAATMDPDPLMIPVTVPKERVPASLGCPARSTATAEEMMLLGLSSANNAMNIETEGWHGGGQRNRQETAASTKACLGRNVPGTFMCVALCTQKLLDEHGREHTDETKQTPLTF